MGDPLDELAKVVLAAWQRWPTDSEQLRLLYDENKAAGHIRYVVSRRIAEKVTGFFAAENAELVEALRETAATVEQAVAIIHMMDCHDDGEPVNACDECGEAVAIAKRARAILTKHDARVKP